MLSAGETIQKLQAEINRLRGIGDPNDPNPEDIPSFRFPPTSIYGRILALWSKPKSQGGMNVDGFEKFPMMLHRARETSESSGQWVTSKPEPEPIGFRNEAEYGRACKQVERWNATCQRIVNNETEYERVRANGEGWCDTPDEALAWRERLEQEVSHASADRIVKDRKLSAKARREAKEVDDLTAEHVPEVTAELVKRAREGRRRGRAV